MNRARPACYAQWCAAPKATACAHQKLGCALAMPCWRCTAIVPTSRSSTLRPLWR